MEASAASEDRLRILIVEDSADDAALLLRAMRRDGLDPVYRRVDTAEAMREALENETWDVITSDYVMPRFSGPDALKLMQQMDLDLPFIIISGKVGEETAVELLKSGAHDYIVKGNLARLVPAIRREIRDAEVRRSASLAQAMLKESEAQFHTLTRVSPVGIFQTDARGACLYVNEQWSAIAGLSFGQATGGGWLEAIHPDDRERVEAEWYRCAAEKLPFVLEYRFQRPDRSVTWVLGRAEALPGDSGQISGFVGTVTDVTRLKLTEEALRASEADLKEAQRVGKLGSWTLEPQTGAVTWSVELYRLFGRDPGTSAPSYSDQECLYAPESWRNVRAAVEKTLLSGQPFELDLEIMTPEGARWLSARGETIVAAGKIVGLRGTALDITERKRSEQSLKLFRALIDQSDDAIEVFDDETLRLVDLNEGACRALGYSREELLSKTAQEIDPDATADHTDKVKENLRRFGYAVFEGTHRRRDGSTFPVEINLRHVQLDKKYGISIARDITERKQAQLAIEANERRFRALIENSSDFIVVLDAQGAITYASPALTRTGGYSVEEVLGRHLADYIHPDDQPIAMTDMGRLLENPGATSFSELRYRHKDDRWVVLAAAAKNVLNDPAIDGIVVNARDVTERYQVRERLRLANEVIENSPTVLYRVRGRGEDEVCEYVSENVRQFGYSAEEMMSGAVRFRSLMQEDELEKVARNADALIAAGAERGVFEYRIRSRDGSMLWIEDHVRFQLREGRMVGRASILRDVTLRKQQEQRIARLDRIRAVLSGINSVIVRVHEETELVEESCRIAVEMGGFLLAWVGIVDAERGELRRVRKGGAAHEFCDAIAPCMTLNGADGGSFAEMLRSRRPYIMNDVAADPCALIREQTLARNIGSYVLLPLLVEETAFGLLALYSAERGFFDDDELTLVGEVAADVAFGWDHIAKDRKVAYLALHDPLTGLANRTLFAERLSQQLRRPLPEQGMTGVGIVDVDRFHDINDTLGLHAGDLVLKTIAGRLKLALGEANVARTDADCFAVYAGSMRDASEVLHIFQRALRDCFGPPFVVNDTELRLSARCGIALFPIDGADGDTVHKNAVAALKRAKDSAERVVFYAPEMNAQVSRRIHLESRLHQALEQRQFELHYQPKFDAKSGSLTGMEALIRWNDPQRGLVPPGDFVPLLEQTGLILEAGQWALERAVQQCNDWHRANLKVPRIAVNVSAHQLRQKDFVVNVQRAIDQFQGERCLDLEITESMIMRDIEANIEKLHALRALGVQIAIDDFGTGYSSLAYLAKLPVSVLKIDRSFVISMLEEADTMTLVSTTIALAHALSLKVVAEGVEEKEQAKILRLLRCDEVQGYLFGRPMPASEVPSLLRSGTVAIVTE